MTHQGLIAKFLRFAAVGGVGFLVDAGTLLLLISAGTGPFVARIVSIALAMLVTWRLNRAFTFGASTGSQTSEGARYVLVALGVAGLNYLIYAAILLLVPACPPVLATGIASVLSMLVSYAGYGRFAFRRA
nr:GtrA family protein [Henriciella sp.]